MKSQRLLFVACVFMIARITIAGVIFQDNFSGYTVGATLPTGTENFTGTVGTQWATTIPANASASIISNGSGGNVLNLDRSTAADIVAAYAQPYPTNGGESITDPAVISCKILIVDSPAAGGLEYVVGGSGFGTPSSTYARVVRLVFLESGQIGYYVGSTLYYSSLRHNLGLWNDVAVSMDFDTKKFDLSVNGQTESGLDFCSTTYTGFTQVVFRSYGSYGHSEIGDLKVEIVPEPTSMALIGFGGIIALVLKKRKTH